MDTEEVIEGYGSAGDLAYFSPWGNVVMYYGGFDAVKHSSGSLLMLEHNSFHKVEITITKGCEMENCLSSFHSLFHSKVIGILWSDLFYYISHPKKHIIDRFPGLVHVIPCIVWKWSKRCLLL